MKNGYDRLLVERLLPAVWDKTYAFGMDNPEAPDPQMPRSKPDPKVGGTIFAHLADINIAWERADLTVEEKRAVYLHYGLGWTARDVAYNQGVTKSTAARWYEQGVGKMLAVLTGESNE